MLKKNIAAILLLGLLSGCINTTTQPDLAKKVSVESNTNTDIKVSFRIKDVASASRIKSIDAYLIKDYAHPLDTTANAYNNSYKYQADVINGVVNIVFKNAPSGGPYYVAIQGFDDVKALLTKNNITETDNTILSTDKNVSRSTNNVTITNNKLVFSDTSTALNITINLTPYNNLPVTVSPQSGSNTPTNGVTVR